MNAQVRTSGLLALTALTLWAWAPASASALSCDGRLVEVGDSMAYVRSICGEPTQFMSRIEQRGATIPYVVRYGWAVRIRLSLHAGDRRAGRRARVRLRADALHRRAHVRERRAPCRSDRGLRHRARRRSAARRTARGARSRPPSRRRIASIELDRSGPSATTCRASSSARRARSRPSRASRSFFSARTLRSISRCPHRLRVRRLRGTELALDARRALGRRLGSRRLFLRGAHGLAHGLDAGTEPETLDERAEERHASMISRPGPFANEPGKLRACAGPSPCSFSSRARRPRPRARASASILPAKATSRRWWSHMSRAPAAKAASRSCTSVRRGASRAATSTPLPSTASSTRSCRRSRCSNSIATPTATVSMPRAMGRSMIPLFVVPEQDGRAGTQRIEGSIHGPTSPLEIVPRLRAILPR